jgi:hypothetical protein
MDEIKDPRARAIIDQLSAEPILVRPVVENAFKRHLAALGLPMLPVHWAPDYNGAINRIVKSKKAAESAARSAAKSAAESAARLAAGSAAELAAESAAWSAARSAGLHAINKPVPEVEKWIGVWSPFVDAYSAGLWLFWITDKEIIAVERPSMRIEDNRLHSSTGPAVSWPSGEEYFFWRGTQVPKEWILKPNEIDPKTALTWQNMEQRRAAAEIIGWGKVLKQLKPKVINKGATPSIGTLLEVDLPNSPGEKFLQVKCGTGREFCICVPKIMKTALQAQAWMWPGVSEDDILDMEART